MQKGSGYILSSTSSQTLAVSPANNGVVDLCPNLWFSYSKAIFFLAGNFFSLTYSWFFLEMHVSFVHCVVMLPHFSSLLRITLCKTIYEKYNYVLHSLTQWLKTTCCISLVPKVRCVILRWKDFCYRHIFVFVLDIFVSPWRDVHPQLQCIYPYLLMILEWNPKLLVWCGTLLLNLKSNWSIANCHHTFHFNVRHCQTFVP